MASRCVHSMPLKSKMDFRGFMGCYVFVSNLIALLRSLTCLRHLVVWTTWKVGRSDREQY